MYKPFQVESVQYVAQVQENTAALTVELWCFVPDAMHFGIQKTHIALDTT